MVRNKGYKVQNTGLPM